MRKRSTDTAREGMMMGEDRFPPVVVKNWTLVFDLNSATAALILMVLLSPCIGSPHNPLPPTPVKKFAEKYSGVFPSLETSTEKDQLLMILHWRIFKTP